MDIIIINLIYFISFLLLIILIVKIVIINTGRKIRYDFFSFFWFSQYLIINSNSKESEKKRELLNKLSVVILVLIFIQIVLSFIAVYELGG